MGKGAKRRRAAKKAERRQARVRKPKAKPARRLAARRKPQRTKPAKRRATKPKAPRRARTARRLATKPKRPAARRPARAPRRPPAKRASPAAPQAAPPRKRPEAGVSVFIGTSVDGFIARENGDLDWLEVRGDAKGEDYGYNAFVGEIDAIVMGRKSFEKVLTFKQWPYGKTPVVVLSTRPLAVPPALRKVVATMADRPSQIMERLARLGLRRLYIDGGKTIQGFLRAGLIDEITISRVPVILGQGVPLFGALPDDVKLKHLETRSFKSGMVQTTYAVVRGEKSKKVKAEEAGDARDRSWRAFLEGMGAARPGEGMVANAIEAVRKRELADAPRPPPEEPAAEPPAVPVEAAAGPEPVAAPEPDPAANVLGAGQEE